MRVDWVWFAIWLVFWIIAIRMGARKGHLWLGAALGVIGAIGIIAMLFVKPTPEAKARRELRV